MFTNSMEFRITQPAQRDRKESLDFLEIFGDDLDIEHSANDVTAESP